MRIVSLACSNTEILWGLECLHHLVGVDSNSDFPSEVLDGLPRLGQDLEIDIDAVAALEPDLVLATLTVPGHETVIEGLEARGLPFVAPAPESLADVYTDIQALAERLGVPERGRALVRRMQAEIGPVTPPAADAPRILVQWWPKPVIAPGRQSWTTDVLHAAGGRGLLDDEDLKSRPIPDDEVAALDPDAIVLSWCGVEPAKYRPDVVRNNPVFADVKAVRTGQVHCVPEAFLGRPGPRLVDGVRALRHVVAQARPLSAAADGPRTR
ncbi:MAG: helical backbone metal receptor [Gemmatimonadota bacterium]